MPTVPDRITKCIGLVSQYNPLSTSPGALVTADNAVIDRENVIEDRRGYATYLTLSNNSNQMMVYSNTILNHNGTTVSYDNSGSPADYSGSYTAITGRKMRFVEAYSNLYCTTTAGIKVFQDIAGTAARNSGSPRSLDPSYTLASGTGFLADTSQVAYRSVILRVDANNNSLFGYPSSRLWVTNSSGGTKNITITVYLPSEVTVNDVLQFYRTATVAGVSTDSAGDEMQLVYQQNPTASDITAGYIVFTDIVTDALRGATLYTSPSQEGIGQANDRPPVAKDIALFRSTFMCYANFSTKQRQNLSLVGVTSLGSATTGDTHNTTTTLDNLVSTTGIVVGMKVSGAGIQAGTTVSAIVGTTVTLSLAATATAAGVTVTFITARTITIAGTTYTFGTGEVAASGIIGVSVTGVLATDIDLTARSIVRVINRYATNTTIYAYYQSGTTDPPGIMMFEERGIGASAFTTMVSHSSIQSQFAASGTQPPVSPTTTTQCTSSNSVLKNAIGISKDGQIEAVPTLQYKLAGAANKEILRIVPLRDSLIIVKEDGVFRMTGNSVNNFDVSPLDLTVICKSAESVAPLANQVFMLSNQGVVAISENGVQVVSREIEPNVRKLLGFTNIGTLAVGAGYESDRAYLLSVPTVSTDTVQNIIYRFNIFTRTWTRWTFGFNSAIVEPGTDKFFFSKPSDTVVYRERKDFADTDYADPESSITITSINTTTLTIVFTYSGSAVPAAGWSVLQGTTSIAIDSISSVGGTYTAVMAASMPDSWATGSASAIPNVGMEVEWTSWTGGAQGVGRMKQVSEVMLLVDDIPGSESASRVTLTFRSNLDGERSDVDIEIFGGGAGWGGSWGSDPWGGSNDSYAYRTYVPKRKQYCHILNPGFKHSEARAKLAVTGIAFLYEDVSGMVSK